MVRLRWLSLGRALSGVHKEVAMGTDSPILVSVSLWTARWGWSSVSNSIQTAHCSSEVAVFWARETDFNLVAERTYFPADSPGKKRILPGVSDGGSGSGSRV